MKLAGVAAIPAVLALAPLLPASFAGAAFAQTTARVAEGRVLRPADSGDPRPVIGQWVVLHRVGSDRAAPLDSVRSGAGGRFRFRYEASGAPDALYFVSATYGGIAYFSPPLRSASVRGGDADVLVYDTTTDTTSLRIQGRHIVVSLPRGPRREIAEIFEIENTSPRTIIAADTVPLWATALPEAAESVSVAPGDVSAAAVKFTSGRAALFAPLSPGVRQLVLTYLLPDGEFPVSIPMQRPTAVLELLLEDPRGRVSGIAVREVEAATIEGRTFRRMLAQDVPASAVVRIDMPSPPGASTRVLVMVAVAAASVMLLALAFWATRRRAAAGAGAAGVRGAGGMMAAMPPPPRSESAVERLIAELAQLDARYERTGPHDAAAESEYRRRRAELKAQLEAVLAAETRPV